MEQGVHYIIQFTNHTYYRVERIPTETVQVIRSEHNVIAAGDTIEVRRVLGPPKPFDAPAHQPSRPDQ